MAENGSESSTGTISYNLHGALNALSHSANGTQIAVAGRDVLKIIALYDDSMDELLNLRTGRVNLNYSSTDVAWHPSPSAQHVMATAATNGAVALWDINRPSAPTLFTEHSRTANRVAFNPHENNLLISGSQDGLMKLFNLTEKNSVTTLTTNSGPVRDISWSPFDSHTLAVATENGLAQVWDLRKADSAVFAITAHQGPAFAVQYHLTDKTLLATGGRDKTIKIWHAIARPTTPLHTVQTIAGVARLRWRPGFTDQIASCSITTDFNIHIWDLNRPFIPIYSTRQHTDVPTDLRWLPNGGGDVRNRCLVSSGKDNRLIAHNIESMSVPALEICTTSISFNAFDDLAFMPGTRDNAVSQRPNHLRILHHHHGVVSDPPTKALYSGLSTPEVGIFAPPKLLTAESQSSLFSKTSHDSHQHHADHTHERVPRPVDKFRYMATHYQLFGTNVREICTHNAKVAAHCGEVELAQSWMIACEIVDTSQVFPSSDLSTPFNEPVDQSEPEMLRNESEMSLVSLDDGSENPMFIHNLQSPQRRQQRSRTVSANFEYGDVDGGVDGSDLAPSPNLSHFAVESQRRGRGTSRHREVATAVLPQEDVVDRLSPILNRIASPESDEAEMVQAEDASRTNQGPLTMSNLQNNANAANLPSWDLKESLVSMLETYCDQGEIQFVVSLALVCQSALGDALPQSRLQAWIFAYLELLSRLKLWQVSASIVRFVKNLPEVSGLSEDSTSVHTCCGRCRKPLTETGWYCKTCTRMTSGCSICHARVTGVYVYCQGCGHGGHLHHIREWFATNSFCPAGCAHACEYS